MVAADRDGTADGGVPGLGPVTRGRRWRIERACDKAIDLDGSVRLAVGNRTVMLVADTVVDFVVANGGQVPDAWRFVRDDGRIVYVFIDEAAA